MVRARAQTASSNLFGLGIGESYHTPTRPPSPKSSNVHYETTSPQPQLPQSTEAANDKGVDVLTGNVIIPPWRRKRTHLPSHLKIATFWRNDLLEKATKEEMLNVTLPKARTARQKLGIDVYTARGLYKVLKVRTIESLAHLLKTQIHLRGPEYAFSMLLEAVSTKNIAKTILASTECLLGDDNKFEEATHAWEVAMGGGMAPEVMIAELRAKERHNGHGHGRGHGHGHGHGHASILKTPTHNINNNNINNNNYSNNNTHNLHHHPNHNNHHDSIQFGQNDATTIANNLMIASIATNIAEKKADNDTVFDAALFEDSDIDDEVDQVTNSKFQSNEFNLLLKDYELLNENDPALKLATNYRRSCERLKVFPSKKFIKQVSERTSGNGLQPPTSTVN